ncbi:hypothetical protein G6F40_013395 [Rhizopus arrhizus]|nr:hypothetical protein G6F40_013395 [Rhizopus arrhizus]
MIASSVAGQAPAQHLARFVAVAVVGQQQHRGQREHHHAQRRHPSARADQRGQPGHAQADQRQRGEEVHVRPAIGAHRHHHVVAAMQQHRRQRRPQPGGGAGGFIAAERAHQQGTGGQVEQDGDENDCHRCSFAYPCGGGDGRGVAARQVVPHVRVPDPAPFRHHRAPAWPWPPDRGEHPRGDPRGPHRAARSRRRAAGGAGPDRAHQGARGRPGSAEVADPGPGPDQGRARRADRGDGR